MAQQPIVYPWTGILANLQPDDFTPLSQRQIHIPPGFRIVTITRIHGTTGFTRYAVVDFVNEWSGYEGLLRFELNFNAQGKGKHAWMTPGPKEGIYGWIADSEDYNRQDPVGSGLQHGRILQTPGAVEVMQRQQLAFLTQDLRRLDILKAIGRNGLAAVAPGRDPRTRTAFNYSGASSPHL